MRVLQSDLSLETHRLRRLLGGALDDDAANVLQAEHSKSISILYPQESDDITLFYTRYAIEIQFAKAVIRGAATPSIVVTVRHGTDRSSVGGTIVDAFSATDQVDGDQLPLDAVAIPADSWVWLELGAIGGSVEEVHVSLFYRVDAAQGDGFASAYSEAFG